jgi:hypothetical protein
MVGATLRRDHSDVTIAAVCAEFATREAHGMSPARRLVRSATREIRSASEGRGVGMRTMIRIAWVVAAVGLIAACGTASPRSVPVSSPRVLGDRVLNSRNLPPALTGFVTTTVDSSTMAPSQRAALLASPSAPDRRSCGDRLMHGGALSLRVPVTDVASTMLSGKLGTGIWSGMEILARYAGDGAVAAMAEVRAVASGCATFTGRPDLMGTVAATDVSYGDEAVLLRIRTTSAQLGNAADEDTIVVRVGDCLILVTEPGSLLRFDLDDVGLKKVTTGAVTALNQTPS